MDSILESLDKFLGLKGKKDDDFIDRLNSRYTMVLILVLTAVTSFYQFNGDVIKCWCPVHFHDSHIKFTNSHCWVKNTYYLPYDEEIPRVHEDAYEKRHMITYYQWVPFILLFQALLFYLPSLVWHSLNQKGGIDSDNILATANTLRKSEQEDNRNGILMLLANQIHRFLSTRKNGRKKKTTTGGGRGLKGFLSSLCTLCGRRVGSYLLILYLVSKVLYIANIFFQLFMLNVILNATFSDYGLRVMVGAWTDHDWHDSPGVMFPRVTMCDFNIRRLGNVHRYTVQCALPLNLFNEKIYVFLWFWLVFVLIVTLLGFFQWLIRSFMPRDRLVFIQNHLRLLDRIDSERDKSLSEKFVNGYLHLDGVFLLRLISHNTNNITTTDVICHLFDFWKAKYADKLDKDNDIEDLKPTLEAEPDEVKEGVHV